MDKLNDLFTKIINKLNKKVDSVEGKQLSTEDFTAALKEKLEGIQEGAEVNKIESISLNGVDVPPDEQSKVDIKAYNEDNKPEIGGRNLISNSEEVSGVRTNPSYNYWGEKIPVFRTTDYGVSQFEVGKLYTLSFNYEVNDITTECNLQLGIQRGSGGSGFYYISELFIHANVGNNNGRFKATFPFPAEAMNAGGLWLLGGFGEGRNESTTISLRNIKLEIGEIATDWTPAPEDKQDKVEMIGGRNYLIGTPNDWKDFAENAWQTYFPGVSYIDIEQSGLKAGDSLILHYDIQATGDADCRLKLSAYDNEQQEVHTEMADNIPYTLAGNTQHIQFNFILPEGIKELRLVQQRKTGTARNGEAKAKKIMLEKGSIPTDWSPAPEDLETTADNFEGVLPIEKGGTNSSQNPNSYSAFDSQAFMPGEVNTKDFICLYRYTSGNDYWSAYATGLKLNVQGSHAYIAIDYQTPSVIIGGGNLGKINWHERLSFKSDITPTQLALASLYETRAISAAASDTPMSSPSIDGELSALDKNMIKVYADLCINPDSGKSVSDIPEHLRSYVSNIVEETLAKRKEEEERYKAEMEKREEEERLKAELEAESAGDEYHDNEPLTE